MHMAEQRRHATIGASLPPPLPSLKTIFAETIRSESTALDSVHSAGKLASTQCLLELETICVSLGLNLLLLALVAHRM